MSPELRAKLLSGLKAGTIVPYLGPGVLSDVTSVADGRPIPADSTSLILAMNEGKPMAPKLMYEFPRAAMNIELKRGRTAVTRFLTRTYGEMAWTRGRVHDWIATLRPSYVIDINRDAQLLDSYAGVPHTLLVGLSRLGGTAYRFKIFAHDGAGYLPVDQEAVDPHAPVLFKPMGVPRPEPTYVASDADYVDYVTELMGGFAIPSFLKASRPGKQYLFVGMRFNRDTERMVMSDIIYGAGAPAGWALIPEPTPKERRFLDRMRIQIIECDGADLMEHATRREVMC